MMYEGLRLQCGSLVLGGYRTLGKTTMLPSSLITWIFKSKLNSTQFLGRHMHCLIYHLMDLGLSIRRLVLILRIGSLFGRWAQSMDRTIAHQCPNDILGLRRTTMSCILSLAFWPLVSNKKDDLPILRGQTVLLAFIVHLSCLKSTVVVAAV